MAIDRQANGGGIEVGPAEIHTHLPVEPQISPLAELLVGRASERALVPASSPGRGAST
jgi:hypothetical protein